MRLFVLVISLCASLASCASFTKVTDANADVYVQECLAETGQSATSDAVQSCIRQKAAAFGGATGTDDLGQITLGGDLGASGPTPVAVSRPGGQSQCPRGVTGMYRGTLMC